MKYYHATFAENMESIMKNGLVPSNGKDQNWSESETAGFVFLATDEEIALDFVETCDKAKNGDKFVCFEVDGDALDKNHLFLDINVHQEEEDEPYEPYAFMYDKPIPPKDLHLFCSDGM